MPEKNQPVVLIVDDERVIADTLSIILSRSGFSTMTAYDGESALEHDRTVHPDVLISDVVMPEMTGVELAIAVTETVPGCKVLLFSGQATTVDLLEKARHRGHDFTILTKPVHPTDMLPSRRSAKAPQRHSLRLKRSLLPANGSRYSPPNRGPPCAVSRFSKPSHASRWLH